jgi:2,5-diamino-6-(ribosylamino)-4(3H)-pyrimidinone 5'-phosphate reductase
MFTKRTFNTLFLLQSLDGKISTGIGDKMDFDKDLPKINKLNEGLQQYYDLEQKTDLCSLNSGKTQAKIGVNQRSLVQVMRLPVSFVVIDNLPHLNEHGCEYFALRSDKFIVVTTNGKHPAYKTKEKYDNVFILKYDQLIDFKNMFSKLYHDFEIPVVTIQTGGQLNAQFARLGLIDEVSIVVTPALVGGKDTPSLIDGESLKSVEELGLIQTLELIDVKVLENSYLHLKYKVSGN